MIRITQLIAIAALSLSALALSSCSIGGYFDGYDRLDQQAPFTLEERVSDGTYEAIATCECSGCRAIR